MVNKHSNNSHLVESILNIRTNLLKSKPIKRRNKTDRRNSHSTFRTNNHVKSASPKNIAILYAATPF